MGVNTSDPKSTFEVNGSMGQTVTTITDHTTLTEAHSIVVANNGATPKTITLPTAIGITGRIYTIKKDASSTADVTIATTAAQTIDGASTLVLKNAGEVATLFSDGAGWKSLSKLSAATGAEWSLKGNANTTPGTDFVGTTDAKDLVVKTNGTSRINVGSDGVTKIGGALNYTKIEADGTVEFNGEATVWEDLRVTLDKGSNSATIDYVFGSGPQIWFFKENASDYMSFVVQMPHAYKIGTNIFPHVHWLPKESQVGNVEWKFDYSWANFGDVFPSITTLTTVESGPFTQNKHMITKFPSSGFGISGTGKNVSSILICRIYRIGSNAADTYDKDAGVLSFDFHYQVDTMGSRGEYTK